MEGWWGICVGTDREASILMDILIIVLYISWWFMKKKMTKTFLMQETNQYLVLIQTPICSITAVLLRHLPHVLKWEDFRSNYDFFLLGQISKKQLVQNSWSLKMCCKRGRKNSHTFCICEKQWTGACGLVPKSQIQYHVTVKHLLNGMLVVLVRYCLQHCLDTYPTATHPHFIEICLEFSNEYREWLCSDI